MYKNILVPLALNHGFSHKSLALAEALRSDGGQITALHVYDIPQGTASTYMGEDRIDDGLKAAEKLLKEKVQGMDVVKADIVRGHAYRTIVEYAEKGGFDCIVIGSHQPTVSDFLIGSTAARVVRHAKCTVHVHRDA